MSSPYTCTDALRAALLLCGLVLCGSAHAAPLEKLLMPGKLTQAHARYEDDCSQCHTSFSQSEQQQLCRACHDKVDSDIREQRGFHGRSPKVTGAECRACHSEHKGRDADIVGLVPALLDHSRTDFALEGAHSRLACGDCHDGGKPLRDAPSQCIACHRKDDAHRGQMGEACADCHTASTWRKTTFDHDTTKFPLTHKHRDVPCASCHADRKYEKTPTACASCHGLQDRHGGLFGGDCASCHDTRDWKQARFDHDKTQFALQGRHRSAPCHACHTEATRGRDLPTQCIDCHRGSDFHQGRLGTRCNDCHNTDGWKRQSFDHDRDTAFPLRAAHRSLTCTACHAGAAPIARSGKSRAPARACADCHRADDVHRGQQGDRCDRCHGEKAWRDDIRFDHDLTRFPLVGLHAAVPCAECHADNAFSATPADCRACHRADDAHDGALGGQCQACHNPSGWTRWLFDHDRQADYPLEGRHAQIACTACHRKPVAATGRIELDRSCGSCHASDDAHRGGFGSDCGRCHQPTAFSDVRIGGQLGKPKSGEAR